MEFAAPTVASPIILYRRPQKRSPETANRTNSCSFVRPPYVRNSSVRNWFGILAVTTLRSPKRGSQPAAPVNIVVLGNRLMLDFVAGITSVKPPYIGLLIPGSFTHRFICRVLTLTTQTMTPVRRLLPDLVSLFAKTPSTGLIEVSFTFPACLS